MPDDMHPVSGTVPAAPRLETPPVAPSAPEVPPAAPEVKPHPEPSKEEKGKTYSYEEFQATVAATIEDRLKRDREARARAEEKARKDAVTAALKEQGEYLKVAEAKEAELVEANARLAEMEVIQGRAERYKAALEKHLASERDGLPKHLVALLDRLDVADQLEWIADNSKAIRAKPKEETPPSGSTPSRRSGTTAIGETTPHLPPPGRVLAKI